MHDHVKHVAAEAAVGAQIEGRGPGWVEKTSVGGIANREVRCERYQFESEVFPAGLCV